MVRKFDELGRVVIPIEIRKKNNWKEGQEVEIIDIDGQVILKTYYGRQCAKCKTAVTNKDNFCSNCGCKLK